MGAYIQVLTENKMIHFSAGHACNIRRQWRFMRIGKFKPSDEDDVIALWDECELIVPWNNPRQDIERKMRHHTYLRFWSYMDGHAFTK